MNMTNASDVTPPASGLLAVAQWKLLSLVMLVVMLGAGAPMAHAVPTQFFGEDLAPGGTLAGMPNSTAARASFLSNLVGVGNENFEGFATGASNNLNLNFGVAGMATLSSSSGSAFVNGFPGAGRFATSGTQYFETRAGPGDTFTVTFSQAVAAFGFYGTDFGDFSGQLTATLTGGGNAVINIPHTLNGPNGAGLFFGLIGFSAADTFTSVAFSSNTGDDVFGFDDMVVGSLQQVRPVPEPGAMMLLGLGIVGLAAAGRRRSRRL